MSMFVFVCVFVFSPGPDGKILFTNIHEVFLVILNFPLSDTFSFFFASVPPIGRLFKQNVP